MDDSQYERISWHMPPTKEADLKCAKYASIFMGCMSPKNHLRTWYSHGTSADCTKERSNIYSCMKLKVTRREFKEKLFEKNREYVREKTSLGPDHFWVERQGCPAEWPAPETELPVVL